jgi:ABC-type nitrate/sulfonate/bicarbonate transport system permease component
MSDMSGRVPANTNGTALLPEQPGSARAVPAAGVGGVTSSGMAGLTTRTLRRVRGPVLLILVPLAVWWVLAEARALGPGFIGPVPTIRALVSNWVVIWYNAEPTLLATLQGALLLLGVTAVGTLLVSLVPRLTPWLVGASVVLGSLPLISVTPALSLFITRGTQLVTTVTFLSGLVPVAAMLAAVARIAQRGHSDLGAVYAASRFRWWRYVGIWQSIPTLDIGLRAMLPACFVGAIVAEWSGATGAEGLGELMVNALFSYQVPLLWASLLLSSLIALGLLGAVALVMEPLRRRVR